MESELKSIVKVSLWVSATMTYSRLISSHTKPGILRLLALLPSITILPFLPFYFSFYSLRGLSGFMLCWLAVFKLLLLSFDSGPLSPSLPLIPFIIAAALPVKLNKQPKPKSDNSITFHRLLMTATKFLLLITVIYLFSFSKEFHLHIVALMLGVFIYLFLDVLLICVPAALKLVVPGGGLELEPQFNSPFTSTSLREFWGRRWNLMVTSVLRPTVYVPVRRRYGVTVGVLVTFLVSGLMHELMFYYCNLATPNGEVTAFFVLHGVCVVGEEMARRAEWWDPPPVIAVPVTLGFVIVTAFWLFFPALLRNGLVENGLEECKAALDFVAALLRQRNDI